MKPKMFVGSSVEGLSVAYAIQSNLHHHAEVSVWDQGVFHLSNSALDSLIQILDRSDFGVFVFTPDDVVNMRGEENRVPRDNVIFELGLFVGRLGKERSFLLMPYGEKDFHLPTDLIGVTPGTYETGRSDGSYESATGPFCNQLRKAIFKLGPISNTITQSQATQPVQEEMKAEKIEEQVNAETTASDLSKTHTEPDWFDYFYQGKYDESIAQLTKMLDETQDDEKKIQFMSLIGRVKAKQDYASGIEYLKKLKDENPSRQQPYLELAYLFSDNNLIDKAIDVIDQGLFVVKEKQWLLYTKSYNLNKKGRTKDAITTLNELIEIDPSFDDGYLRLAQLHDENDDKDEALKILEKGLQESPKNQSLLFKYGVLLWELNRNDAALTMFTQLVALSPENSTYLGYQGNVYLSLDLYGLALDSYQKGSNLAEEKASWILGNIGNLFQYKGLNVEAIKYLKNALILDPESAYAHERLAMALKQNSEENKKAEDIIRKYKQSKDQSNTLQKNVSEDGSS